MNKFIKGFFWFAFAAFLGASIPHVAYFFRAFEPQGDGQDMIWWGVSFAIAVSIDITIFLLSLTVAGMHRRNAAGGLIFSVWVFVLGLTALSWYINGKYAMRFIDTSMISPTALNVPYLGRIADINPIIASMFQVLAIAYTWVADKIAADEKPKTAAELAAELAELEQVETLKQRKAAIKRGGNISGFTGSIDFASTVAKHAWKAVTGVTQNTGAGASGNATPDMAQNEAAILQPGRPEQAEELPEKLEKAMDFLIDNPDGTDEKLAEFLGLSRPATARFWRLKAVELLTQESEEMHVNNGRVRISITEQDATSDETLDAIPSATPDATLNEASLQHHNDRQDGSITPAITGTDATLKTGELAENVQVKGNENATKNDASESFTGQRTLTIKEAATQLENTEAYVRSLIQKGKLRTSPRNNKLVLTSSLNAFITLRKTERKTESKSSRIAGPITDVLPALKLVPTEQENDQEKAS